jgi:hypothetical protein
MRDASRIHPSEPAGVDQSMPDEGQQKVIASRITS